MDTSILKQNAKKNLQKNHWNCVIVAFLMSLAGVGIPSINLNFDSMPSDSAEISNFFNEFEGFFSSPVAYPMIITLITGLVFSSVISIVLRLLVFTPMSVGGKRYFLKLRKNQPTEIGEVAVNFKDKTFISIAKTTFFKDLYTALFTLLFIIPGIIKSYEYSMVNYILAVRPDIDHRDALRLSKEIMRGHKFEFFILTLSFIGWNILTAFTCGLLSLLYVNPYIQATNAEFFCFVREDAIARGVITPYDIPDYEPYMPPAPATPFYSTTYGMNTYPQSFTGQSAYPQAPMQNTPVSQVVNQPPVPTPDTVTPVEPVAPVTPVTPITPFASQESEHQPQTTQVICPETSNQETEISNEEVSLEDTEPTTES